MAGRPLRRARLRNSGAPDLFMTDQDRSDADMHPYLYGPDPFCFLRPGASVAAHLNLGHKWNVHRVKTFVLKDGRATRTLGHVLSATIEDVRFVVQAAGNKKAREKNEKSVHALIKGRLVSNQHRELMTELWRAEAAKQPGGAAPWLLELASIVADEVQSGPEAGLGEWLALRARMFNSNLIKDLRTVADCISNGRIKRIIEDTLREHGAPSA